MLALESRTWHNWVVRRQALQQSNKANHETAVQAAGVRETRQPLSSETCCLTHSAQPLCAGDEDHENKGGLEPRAQA